MTGHPDDQDYVNWRGPDFFAQSAFNLSASTPALAQGLVTNFASLMINVTANCPGGVTVTVQWFTDSTLAIPLGSMVWKVAAGQILKVAAAAIGNYFTFTATTSDAGATGCPISVYPCNAPAGVTSYWGVDNYIFNPNFGAPANSTSIFQLPYVSQGSGYFWVSDPNTTGKIQAKLITLKLNGTADGTLAQYNTIAPFQTLSFVGAAVPIGISIINVDTLSHSVSYYLTIDGR